MINEELKELAQKEKDLRRQEQRDNVFSELTPGRRPRHLTSPLLVSVEEFSINMAELDGVRDFHLN